MVDSARSVQALPHYWAVGPGQLGLFGQQELAWGAGVVEKEPVHWWRPQGSE